MKIRQLRKTTMAIHGAGMRTRRKVQALRIVAATILFFSLAAAEPGRFPNAGGFAAPRPAALAADKGRLRIMVGGQQAGKEDFEITQNGANWLARGTSEVKGSDGITRVTGTLELHADGTPAHYEWSMQGGKKASATIVFNGPTATINLVVGGAKPFTQQFTFAGPMIAVLDNNLYHQYGVLARLYDWNKKGVQTFSVLVPQAMTPGSVTVEWLGAKDLDGKKLDELRVKTEDLELDLYLENQRLVRIDAPESNAEIVRE
jgi:hypothetical protein